MTFSNPIYTAVTTHFFDFLSNNINKAFESRCHELYYKNGKASENVKISGAEMAIVPNHETIAMSQVKVAEVP